MAQSGSRQSGRDGFHRRQRWSLSRSSQVGVQGVGSVAGVCSADGMCATQGCIWSRGPCLLLSPLGHSQPPTC